MTPATLQQVAGYPSGKRELIKQFHSTNDIVNAVIEQHGLNKAAAAKIAKYFEGPTIYKIAQKLWGWAHSHLNYVAEPDTQTVKSFQKILADSLTNKGNDCKHFSGFIGSILDALNIPFVYRFVAFSGNTVTHVYPVITLPGREIVIDACLPYFDSEKAHSYKIDFTVKKKDMPLYRVSGVNGPLLDRIKAGLKNIGTGLKNNPIQTISNAAASAVFFQPRNAFKGLVFLNFYGLANKLAAASQKNYPKVKSWWEKWGGSWNDLANTINAGKNKAPLKIPGIGMAAETTAAIAEAAVIIATVKPVLAELGIDISDIPSLIDKFRKKDKEIKIPEGVPMPKEGADNNILLIAGSAIALILILRK